MCSLKSHPVYLLCFLGLTVYESVYSIFFAIVGASTIIQNLYYIILEFLNT